jgi:predicted TIM-barrel fold metal-dependent hydrolase
MTSIPIIDTHIHLFDTRRPQGVPWPEKTDMVLYKPALPGRYLDQMVDNSIFVGTAGDLEAGKPGFGKNLERFHRNPLFLGIRCGNIWDRNLAEDVHKPAFIADLKLLADAGLEMDTADPDAVLIGGIVRLTDKVPNLRIVIDHLPQITLPTGARALSAYRADLRELGKRRQVYAKVSEVFRRVEGKVPLDLSFYRATIDELWDIFGEDRLMFGSDWPNSDTWAPYAQVLDLVRQYFFTKGPEVANKFFWKNSLAVYHWKKRAASQPGPERG